MDANIYKKLRKKARAISLLLAVSLMGMIIIVYLMYGLLSSTRVFTGYHSLWSHTQNRALIHLISYSESGDYFEYQKFEENLMVMDGIQNALYELNMDLYDEDQVERSLGNSHLYAEQIKEKVRQLHQLRRFDVFKNLYDRWETYHINSSNLRDVAHLIKDEIESGGVEDHNRQQLLFLAQNLNVTLLDDHISLLQSMDEATLTLKNYSMVVLALLSLGIFFIGGLLIHSWQKNLKSLIQVSKERDRLASFPELNPNPIIVIDETSEISYLNVVAEKLLNSSKTNGNGNQILDFIKLNAHAFFDENISSKAFEIPFNEDYFLAYAFKIEAENSIHFYLINITERKNLELNLKKSYAEKTVLLSEVHHRVKNNLAVAIALLEIEMLNSEESPEQLVLKRSLDRLHSISSVHKIFYDQESIVEMRLSDFITEFAKVSIFQIKDKFLQMTSSEECRNYTLSINQAVPCALLLNELISDFKLHDGGHKLLEITVVSLGNAVVEFTLSSDCFNWDTESESETLIQLITSQLGIEGLKTSKDNRNIMFSFTLNNKKGSSSALPKDYFEATLI